MRKKGFSKADLHVWCQENLGKEDVMGNTGGEYKDDIIWHNMAGIEQGNKGNRANIYSNTQLGDSFKNLTKDDK